MLASICVKSVEFTLNVHVWAMQGNGVIPTVCVLQHWQATGPSSIFISVFTPHAFLFHTEWLQWNRSNHIHILEGLVCVAPDFNSCQERASSVHVWDPRYPLNHTSVWSPPAESVCVREREAPQAAPLQQAPLCSPPFVLKLTIINTSLPGC